MTDRVPELWAEIIAWLRQHAPTDAGRLRPPAPAALIAEVEASVGRPLPEDLRQWWQQADGAVRVAGVYLLPWGFAPMSCQGALADRTMRLEIAAEQDDEEDDPYYDADDEDDEDLDFFGFHEHHLPIGDDHCGNCLLVDLSDTPRYGSIRYFDHEGPTPHGALWTSVTEMLTDIRDALTDGKPALAHLATVTPSRELSWVPET